MKISLNWIKKYTDTPLDDTKAVVEAIGAQLGAVEEVVDLGPRYQGAVVVKVVECSDHADSDHLHVCLVDDSGVTPDVERNQQGLVQVVCGAPNVKTGVTAIWLPPKTTVPETYDKEPFVLEARSLRGVVSNGMLASARELALGDNHEGLLLLDEDVKPGTSLTEALELDDTIIDIENKMFTHRPDCFGQLGVARELAGIFDHAFKSPDWYLSQPELPTGSGLPLEVINDIPEVVPRFMAVALADITIGPSPVWLQTYLARVGVRPINNVVDVTNYLMLLTGQPLHAYDYDKVKTLSGGEAAKMVVRYPRQGEKIALLNGKTVDLRPKDILISCGDQPIGLGGVMGGGETEVDDQTTNLILEVATFNMYTIRRTSMEHGLFSDAVTRYTKGQSPWQNDRILAEAVQLLADHAGAKPASPVSDLQADLPPQADLTVDVDFINRLLGLELDTKGMVRLLTNVEFRVDEIEPQHLQVRAPFWRTDIALPEDVAEEIGRLYGFDKLPLSLPTRNIAPTPTNSMLDLKAAVRQSLAGSGANEVLTYSFVHGDLLKKVGQQPEQAWAIGNALSPDLQYYRLSLLPSLLDKVHANIKAGYDQLALFELGKAHINDQLDENGLPQEFEAAALVYAVRDKVAPADAAYYRVQYILKQLARDLRIDLVFEPLGDKLDAPVYRPFEPGRSAHIMVAGSHQLLGVAGEFTAAVRQSLKLPEHSAGFEIDLSVLRGLTGQEADYQPLSRFPGVSQDLCLRVPVSVTYRQVYDLVAAKAVLPATRVVINPVDIYQRPDETDFKQITVRINLVNYEKTLTDKVVGDLLADVAEAASTELQASRI